MAEGIVASICAMGKYAYIGVRSINVLNPYTGNIYDRPSLKDLYDHVVIGVAPKWKDIGVQLLRSDQLWTLRIIELDHPHDAVECCKCVLNKWLDTTTDATWNQLISALRSPTVQLDCLAAQIESMAIVESGMYTGMMCQFFWQKE